MLVVLAGIVWLRFPDFFQDGNSKVIEPYGDGFKAYTVVYYHAKHDSTYSHFEGMNYPYGEHVIPAATQPVISNAMRWLRLRGLDFTPYTIGIINHSLLLSLIIAGLFTFWLLRRLGLPWLVSMMVAIGLTFLAPQFQRIPVHYGLAHVAVFPLLFYGWLRFYESKHWVWSLFIGVIVAIYAGIHFYYVAIIGMTITLLFGVWFFQPAFRNERLKWLGHLSVQFLVPIMGYAIWIYVGDPIDDRCATPYGFFSYNARLHSVLTATYQPLINWTHQFIPYRANFEGEAYIGITAIMGMLLSLVWWLRRKIIPTSHNGYWVGILLTSLAVLLFSFGLPFIIPGLKGLLTYFGPIQQFRSIGRFAWVFFFAINIWTWTFFYHHLPKWLVYSLLLPFLLEAYHSAFHKSIALDDIPSFQEGQRFTDLPIDYSKYQAIMTIPHYNIGSDNFWLHAEGFNLQNSLALSMQTGLPVMSAMLTRTSRQQTINQIQLVSPPYRDPVIIHDLPNHQPLLALVDMERYHAQKETFAHIVENGQLLFQQNRLALYEIPLQPFQGIVARKRSAILQELKTDRLFDLSPFQSNRFLQDFHYESFDGSTAARNYLGSGGWEVIPQPAKSTQTYPLPHPEPDSSYVLSFWFFADQDLAPRTFLRLAVLDQANQKTESWQAFQLYNHIYTFDNNGWALVHLPFVVKNKNAELQISLDHAQLKNTPIFIDELLIKPTATNLYQSTSSMVWKNNLHFPR